MFPNLKYKKFHDLATGRMISVIDQFEDLAVLDTGNGKQKINVNKLLDINLFEEYIDPKSFLGESSLSALAEKIRSIPSEVLENIKEDTDESLVLEYDPEEEKRMLLEKAKTLDNSSSIVSQYEKFKDLIEDDADVYIVNARQSTTTITEPVEAANQQNMKPTSLDVRENQSSQISQTTKEDPMLQMFKNIKRKENFQFTLTVEGKIPRPDFLEMMEDSYEVSIIDYLANEFTQDLLNNPDKIKSEIKEKIKQIVENTKSKPLTLDKEETIMSESSEIKPKVSKARQKNKKTSDSPIVH